MHEEWDLYYFRLLRKNALRLLLQSEPLKVVYTKIIFALVYYPTNQQKIW